MRLPPEELNLEITLFSGQAFTWSKVGEEVYEGFALEGQRTLWVRLERVGEEVFVRGAGEGWLRRYFNLDLPLDKIISSFPEELRGPARRLRGLRLLKLEPWEALVSFIISQNNNIKRISLIVRRMARRFGRFPLPEDLIKDLSGLGLGYREPYLRAAAEAVLSGKLNLEEIGRLPYEEAKARLLKLKGVGPKVADCVLLYGYGFQEAFPKDVWVKRYWRDLDWGPYAGWAQLYLYTAARLGLLNSAHQNP